MRRDWDIQEVGWPADPYGAVQVWSAGAEVAWLDGRPSGLSGPAWGGQSLVCTRPVGVLEQRPGAPARFTGSPPAISAVNAWDLWQSLHARYAAEAGVDGLLLPGWVGYVGFEMATRLERLPPPRPAPLGLPLLRLALFDRGVVLDHARRRAYGVRVASSFDTDPDWRSRWNHAAAACRAASPTWRAPAVVHGDPDWYSSAVVRALEYIAAGDIYQVNLARCIRLSGLGDPLEVYRRVRESNPAPYAALLRWDGGAIASVSPELFLRLDGRAVLTSPIKGTRPRSGDAAADAVARAELLASPKERAELAMIVDLHRNDLGRACAPGSVQVSCARRLEAHPSVLHTVADVTGQLAPGRDPIDLLRACFPAGSISGVPKIRALEIIHELEPVGRGAYTGALGVLSLSGDMLWNVAIRTLQIRPPAATLYVGGGIVADSDPAAEYAETCAKAAGILRGLGATARTCDASRAARLAAARSAHAETRE